MAACQRRRERKLDAACVYCYNLEWIQNGCGRTCVVYGMPRAMVEAGLSDRSVSLDRMAQVIMEVI